MPRGYQDRIEAGRALAAALRDRPGLAGAIVLALPRGGAPVALPVAAALDAPLDLALVRKLGAPGREELALGAIAQRLMRAKAPISVRTRHNARLGITNASFMVEGRHGLAFAFPEDGRGLCALFDRTGRADFYRFTLVELPLPASDTVS